MRRCPIVLAAVALLAGCPDFTATGSPDGATTLPDAGAVGPDAGTGAGYRAALVVRGGGAIDIVDFTAQGAPTVARTLTKGADPESPWPDWSADGTQLAYPAGGAAPGAVYLYDVETSADPYDWFAGNQPSFSRNDLTLVARAADDAVVHEVEAKRSTKKNLSGVKVRWPRFDPVDPARFAYLDETTASIQLFADGDTGLASEQSDLIHAFAWLPASGGMVLLRADDGARCEVVAGTLSAGKLGSYVPLATNVECSARLIAAPVGANVAIVSGSAIHVLSMTASVDAASAPPTVALDQPALDADWTGDGAYIAVLKPVAAGGPGRLFLVDPAEKSVLPITTTGDYDHLRTSPALH